jgi:hypothetical protein
MIPYSRWDQQIARMRKKQGIHTEFLLGDLENVHLDDGY